VGESGSGKSVTAASLMQILSGSGHILKGSSVYFEGEELVGMSEAELRKIRGNKIAMIFQDPMTALNPVFTIEHQMEEANVAIKSSKRPIRKLWDCRHRYSCKVQSHALERQSNVRSRCSVSSASPTRKNGSSNIRSSSRAACSSGS
jgi:ABC-type dipeptide/oligopeptide/nickel transport system ATPase component